MYTTESYHQLSRSSSPSPNTAYGSGPQASSAEKRTERTVRTDGNFDGNNNSVESTTTTDDQQKQSIIRGMTIDNNGQDLTKRVRRMVMDWKDSSVNGNYIVRCDAETVDGATVIVVTSRSGYQTELLVRAAAKHLVKGTGIVWTSMKSPTPTAGAQRQPIGAIAHPNRMFVVTGLNSRTTDDVLDLVWKTCFAGSDVRRRDIVDVSRDHKWRGRDGPAVLFVTAVDARKKRLALDLVGSGGHRLPAGVQLKDYNGFKH